MNDLVKFRWLKEIDYFNKSKKWISGKDLVNRWGITYLELFDLVKKGLHAYTEYEKIEDSDPMDKVPRHTLDFYIGSVRGADNASRVLGGSTRPPLSEEEVMAKAKSAFESQTLEIVNPPKNCKLISFLSINDGKKAAEALSEMRFKMGDVLSLDREHGIFPQESQVHPTPPVISPSDIISTLKQSGPPDLERTVLRSFIKKGDYWTIKYEEREVSIKHLLGLQYIAYLLERPGKNVSCINLYYAANPPDKPPITKEEAAAQGLFVATKSREVRAVNTSQTQKELGKKYLQLQNDLERAESSLEKAEIEKEMEYLLDALKNNYSPDPINSKAQANIKRGINRAIDAIGRSNFKALAAHLKDNIKPDGEYGYTYTGAPWEITL